MKDYYYRLWHSIKNRCYNRNKPQYKYYGGRGITMFGPWFDDFDYFVERIIEEIGPRPAGLTLDRVDNNGNYEPGNLRWATQEQQISNRRRPVIATNTGHRNISRRAEGSYKVNITIKGVRISKYCKTLEEALVIRSKYLKLIGE